MMFQNKLNHKNSFCVLWRSVDVSLRPGIRDARHQSFSASTQPSQTRHARPKKQIFLRENQTHSYSPVISKSARSCHYYLAKSARSRHYYLSSDHTIHRGSRERCWKKWTLLITFVFIRQWIGKQFWPDIDPLRHATWYGLSVSNTDFGLFWDDTAVSRCDTDFRQIPEKQFMNMCSETKQFYLWHN